MDKNYLLEPLSEETLSGIAQYFPENANCDKYMFIENQDTKVYFGTFSTVLSGHHAKWAAYNFPNLILVMENRDPVHFGEERTREYLALIVGITPGTTEILLHESIEGTILSEKISVINPRANVPYYNMTILIPRKNNKRENKIGTAVLRKEDNSIYIEFKRDGNSKPALN